MDENTPGTTPPPLPPASGSGPGAVPPPPPPPPQSAAYSAPPPASATAPPYPLIPPPYVAERKSPALAGFLSFFPGLGHLYLGLYQRGIFFGLAFVICISLSAHGHGGFFGPLIAFVWFFGVIDAVRQAHAINRGYVSEGGYAPSPLPARRMSGTAGLTWGVVLVGIGLLWLIDQYVDIDWSFLDRWGAPAAFILLGLVLIVSHVRKKRQENEAGVGMPPKTY
jgi:hypothetical protein